jgi:tetratricopeptide (TPR) repeat protein
VKRICCLAVAVLLAAGTCSTLYAQQVPDAEEAAWAAERELDLELAATHWNDALRWAIAQKDSAWANLQAEVYLERCNWSANHLGLSHETTQAYQETLEWIRKQEAHPLLRDRATYALLLLATMADDRPRAETLEAELGFVYDWMVVGPFENRNNSGMNRDFGPETAFAPDAKYDGKARPVQWRPLTVHPRRGAVQLDTLFSPHDHAVAYVTTAVQVDADTDVALRFGSTNGGRIDVNGLTLWDATIRRPEAFDQNAVGVRLKPGWNRIVLKVPVEEASWAYRLRITGPDGGHIDGLTVSASPEHLLLANPQLPSDASVAVSAGMGHDYESLVQDTPDDARVYFYGGYLTARYEHHDHDRPVVRNLFRRAVNSAPDKALYHYYLGLYATGNKRMAAEKNENETRLALEEAIKLDPHFVPAYLDLANYYLQAFSNIDTAWEITRKTQSFRKETPEWTNRLMAFYRIRGWEIPALKLGESGSSDYLPIQQQIALLYESIAPEKAAAIQADILTKMNGNDTNLLVKLARRNLFGADPETGHAQIDRILWLNPFNTDVHILRAELAYKGFRYETAIENLDKVLALNPNHPDAWARKGNALYGLDRKEDAFDAWSRSLELDPKQLELREFVEVLTEHGDAWETAWRENWDALSANFPESPEFGDANRATLYSRDVVLLNPDGTKNVYRRRVVKVLSNNSVENDQVQRIGFYPGEERLSVLSARVIHPDGTIAEARTRTIGGTGDDSRNWSNHRIELPPLSVGDIIDIEYTVEDVKQSFFGSYFGDIHRFGSFDPVVMSQYILIAPNELPIYHHVLNSDAAPAVSEADGNVVRTWTLRDLQAVPYEAGMPDLEEILPTLQISTFKDWDELASWYWDLIRKQHVLTDEMKARLKKLVAGIEDPHEQIKQVYNFVTSEIRYEAWEFGVHGYKPYSADTIFERGFGDCKDKALVINVMLQELGFHARPVLIFLSQDARSTEDITLPMFEHFNHCISGVILEDGTQWFLDGTAAYYGATTIPPGDHSAEVIIVDEDKAIHTRVPAATADNDAHESDYVITVQEDGSAILVAERTHHKANSAYLRYYLTVKEKRTENIEKMHAATYPGMKVSGEVQVKDFYAFDKPFTYRFAARIPEIGENRNGTLHVNSMVLPLHPAELAKQATRQHDLLLESPYRETYRIRFDLPKGWSAQAPTSEEVSCEFGSYSLAVDTTVPGRIDLVHTFEISKRRIPADQYPEFRRFCTRAEQVLGRRILLEQK